MTSPSKCIQVSELRTPSNGEPITTTLTMKARLRQTDRQTNGQKRECVNNSTTECQTLKEYFILEAEREGRNKDVTDRDQGLLLSAQQCELSLK